MPRGHGWKDAPWVLGLSRPHLWALVSPSAKWEGPWVIEAPSIADGRAVAPLCSLSLTWSTQAG